MSHNSVHSPYTLQLHIHNCEALPIADITSSDPYVVIIIGGRLENRTKTIFRNRNPVWNEEFSLKILHRRSVIALEIYDEDKGKEDDQIGIVHVDLTDLPLDVPIRKKYSVTASAGFDTTASKIDVTMTIRSNESVIQIVPDEKNDSTGEDNNSDSSIVIIDHAPSPAPDTDTSSSIDSELNEIVDSLVREHSTFKVQESVINALTSYITQDRARFFSKEMLQDLLWDASSLTHSDAEAAELLRTSSRAVYNRTQLRVLNASRLILSSKKCSWHPPIPPNSLQLNLLANDSKFITIQFTNRLAMWVCTRWLVLLHDVWKGFIKASELPSWASGGLYTTHCTVQRSDGHSMSGAMVLARERPFELRVKSEFTSFKNLHNIVMSADSLKPKEYLMDIEVLSFGATAAEESVHEENILEEEVLADSGDTEKGKPSSPKKGIFNKMNRAGHGLHKAVRRASLTVAHAGMGVADVAVGAATGVAGSTLGAARSLVTGHPTDIIHQAQDDLLSVGQNFRSFLHDATSTLAHPATYTVAKFDHSVMLASPGEHVYIDLNEDSFVERTLRRTRSEIVSSDETSLQEDPDRKFPDMNRTDAEISFLLCHNHSHNHSHSAQQGLLSHKRLTAQMLRQNEGVVYAVPLNVCLEYKIELIHSHGLQLASPGRAAASAKNMYVKMKIVDRHGNSKPLGHLQEVKTASFAPTSDPDWHSNASFPAQEGFDRATYLRIEVCVEDFTSHYTIGSCFVPLNLFRKKSQEYTFPMTPFKQRAVQACDNNVSNALGETTFRIHRVEDEVPSSAVMTVRPRLIEANVFNTRWYCECLLAGSVNSEHSKTIEEFSLMPSMEGLELVATGRVPLESAHEHNEGPSDDHSTSSGLSSPASPYAHITRVTPITVAAEPSAEPNVLSTDWSHGAEHETYEIEIEVYENQRRQAFYPFEWSAEAKTRPAFSDLSYDVHYTFPALSAAAAPEGFEWKTEWCLDKTHISTDPHGWIYGYTFGTILSKYKQGKSRIKPSNMMARRRKWVRRAVSVNTGHKDTSVERNTAHQFAKANSLDGVQIMDTSVHSEDENSPHSPSSPMPKSPTSLTPSEATSWRNEVISHSPKALIAVCQERYSNQSHVLIPWEQVKDAYVVSPSVLSIYVTVHRYMADHTTHAAGCFRAAEVEVFVSNCPAVELKSMIDERKWFSSFKSQIRTLVQAGHVSGKTEALIMGKFLSTISEDDDVPHTEDLSLGSELVADLSENSIVLEARVQELDSYLGAHNVKVDNQTTKEKSIILRRDCRLRVYMAALFGMGLEGHHHYLENEVRAIMKRDFLLAQHIQQDTEVATANNRIEFYLDTAETRIRDAILCGWNYRDSGKLQRTLEIFANGYFIEIVGLLGSFFEDNGKTAVKGLGSKVGLINTYLKHNDRLATIIDHALRPYALRTQPAATLSLFLDFNILVSWYTSVLLAEMRQRADHVLNVWKDPTKDVTDQNSEYLYAVPWVPLHTEHKNTQFFTQIPEDLAEVLTTYLQHARVHKDTVAPSFHDSVGRLDAEVLTAYTSSFLHLCEQMTAAVESKDWAASEIEEELAEYATWLASVANDAHRVEANQLYAPSYVTHTVAKNPIEEKVEQESSELDDVVDQEEGIEKRTLKAFHRLAETALDHLCCIVFVYVFHERPHLLRDQLYTTWIETLPDLEGGVEVEPIIPTIMEDVVFFLEGKQAFLHPFCYWKLVSLTAEKVFILYLSLFKSAHQAGAVFGSREITQIRDDIAAMKDGLLNALEKSPSESDHYLKTAHAIVDRFAVLESCCELFECDIASQQLDTVMKQLVHTAESTPADAAGMAGLLETCLGLKGVLRYTARTMYASRTVTPRASMASGSSFTDLIAAVTAGRPESTSLPSTPSPVKTPRRRSLFGSFFVREPSPEPIAFSPTALPRTQSMRLPTKEEGALLAQRAMAMSDAEIAAEAQQYEEEKEQEMVRLANEIREQALIDCFALMIQDLRNHAPVTHVTYTSLTQSSSLERVFGTDSSSEFPLEVQLLHSAHPPSSDHHRAASTRIGRLGGSLQRLFHSPKKEW